ncbi:uncharacterized protein ASPGLDRAFT_42323 [Aspergillus glaucus CBS 516.65]|uniref:Uncharacterized protein n=1 Tax=Aspergillus glaucus CBS 516.65 TaxID=1160497 RepID=A0A1L9VXU0_ASPGL|nr:hypothetical protein ASPGLDRAFT_42323 [Aspergillus glaucus CBS 516.65]OJJ88743.1 hypothetical protein ASPGLDRAFT_42323 [Aspergillus glaucus CBS 516.65]
MHAWCDVLSGLALTATSHICHAELRSAKVVSIGSEFLGHQEQPVFQSGFLSIGQHWRIRNLGGLSSIGGRWHRFLVAAVGQLHGHLHNLVAICVMLKLHPSKLRICLGKLLIDILNLLMQLGDPSILGFAMEFLFSNVTAQRLNARQTAPTYQTMPYKQYGQTRA